MEISVPGRPHERALVNVVGFLPLDLHAPEILDMEFDVFIFQVILEILVVVTREPHPGPDHQRQIDINAFSQICLYYLFTLLFHFDCVSRSQGILEQ
jgi:hypothetical protein